MFDNRTISMFGAAVVAVVAAFLLVSLLGDQAVMGEPVGTTGGKEKPSGPDGPSDDDIDDLLGGEDDDEGDNGLWQANVGGTEFSGLDKENVGDVLFRGESTTRTFVDEDGNERSMKVCANIPEIETSKDYGFDTPGSDGIELLLDFSTCVVSVASVTYGVVDEAGANEGEPSPQPGLPSGYNRKQLNFTDPGIHAAHLPHRFDSPDQGMGIYALYRDQFAEEAAPQHSSNRVVRADIRAQVVAADGVGFALTETQLRMVYSAPNMNILSYFTSCDADSPAIAIRWIERSCFHGASQRNSSRVSGYVKGTYDAWPLRNAEHQSSVSFQGYSNRYRATCWWSDDLDHISVLGLTVRLRCDEQ